MENKFIKSLIRPRNLYLIWGSIVFIIYFYWSDPNNGNSILPFIGALASPVLAVLFAHLGRKALFDYIDMGTVYKKAKETATGSGLVFVGICLVIYGLLGLFGSKVFAQDVYTYIPKQAYEHIPTLKEQAGTYAPNYPKNLSLPV